MFPTVEETLAELALPPDEWTEERVERSTREVEGPDGLPSEFVDNILALRRG